MIDRRAVIERVLSLNEIAIAEKTDNLCVNRIATWDNPKVEYAYQNKTRMTTLAFLFPLIGENQESWIKDSLEVISTFDACIICFPSEVL